LIVDRAAAEFIVQHAGHLTGEACLQVFFPHLTELVVEALVDHGGYVLVKARISGIPVDCPGCGQSSARTRTRVETCVDRRPPTTASEWLTHLAELTRQLETGGQVAAQHCYHDGLYGTLIDAVAALGNAHPGGLDQLQPRR